MFKGRGRWGDNDKHYGPFTIGFDKDYKCYGVVLTSEAEEDPGCHIRFRLGSITLICELPEIIKAHKVKVVPGWDEDTVKRLGRNCYWDIYCRKYGFDYHAGFLQVFLGVSTNDSLTDKTWCKFLPWTEWRITRTSLYTPSGKEFFTQWEQTGIKGIEKIRTIMAAKDSCPSESFIFEDYDGEVITAKTIIEEREWKFGEGRFKWLSLFRKNRTERSLDIEFSKETGPRKGSWKGGTIGHGIDMLSDKEPPDQAFRRYCEENNMTFIGIHEGEENEI